MKAKRVTKGNFSTLPTGSEVLGAYMTNAVTEDKRHGKGNAPIPSIESVVEAREFMQENKK